MLLVGPEGGLTESERTAALAAGFEVLLVADAVGSRTDQNRELAIARLARAGAAIVSHEMIAFEWLERGDAPEFQDILPLLK